MWGPHNERADATKGQMMGAAQAQVRLAIFKADPYIREHPHRGTLVDNVIHDIVASGTYPTDWSGFRSYGPDCAVVADLVVAAAYLRSEIKRRVFNGEDTTRTSRPKSQPYSQDTDAGKAGLPRA